MAVKRSTVRRRESYHHGDLKRALTSAALSLVAEKGPKGFTLTEAARRAGVSAAAPYRHFADKAELLASVAEQGFRELHAELAAAADRVSDPKERVTELGRAYVRWAIAHPDHYQVMFGASLKAEQGVAVAGEQAFGDLLDAITRCQEAGMVATQDPARWPGRSGRWCMASRRWRSAATCALWALPRLPRNWWTVLSLKRFELSPRA